MAKPQAFAEHFTKLLKAAGDKAQLVVKGAAFELVAAIEEKSPVGNPTLWKHKAPAGYTGGQFRANWNTSINAVDTSTTKATAAGTATANAHKALENYKLGDKIIISNSLPYAFRLEYEGWSGQAPRGVVRMSAMEFRKHIKDQASKL
jgi:hypothetical protein